MATIDRTADQLNDIDKHLAATDITFLEVVALFSARARVLRAMQTSIDEMNTLIRNWRFRLPRFV